MADVQELLVNLRFTETGSGLAAIKTNMAGVEAGAVRLTGAVGNAALSVKNLVGAFVGFQAVQQTVGFLKDAVSAAIEDEADTARLTAALKANASAWQDQSAAIDNAIASGANLGFTDDHIRDSLGRLSGATQDFNKALQIQNVAMDLARFKNVDLGTATDALIRIEAGRFRGLADLGIVLKQGATETEALAAVEKLAAGQAEAFGDTSAGAAARAQVAFHELEESIGRDVLPVLTDLANLLSGGTQSGINKQGEDIAKQTALFVKTATIEQIKAAREGVAQELAKNDSAFGPGNLFGSGDKIRAILAQLDQALLPVTQGMDESARAALNFSKAAADADANVARLNAELLAAGPLSTQLGGDLSEADTRTAAFATAARDAATALIAEDLAAANLAARLSGPLNRALAGTADAQRAFSFTPGGDADALAAHSAAEAMSQATRDAAAAKALADAKAAAAAYAQVLKDNLNLQLSNAKDLATSLFDKLHERHLQAINDVEALAQKNRDATTAQIADVLRLQLARDAAPVNAAERAQSDIEISRQHRDLGAALATAQASGDPLAIRQAQEALQSFQAQQHITYLKEQQAIHDLAAQADAAAKQKAADDALNAAKLAQAAALKQETDRQQKQLKDFDNALAALKKRDEGASPSKVRSDITALEKRFGIVTDPSGFHHIEDPLVTAIKNVKIPTPVINQTNYFTLPPITLNGRAISQAIALALSPSSASSVRTGNLKPIG